MEVHDRDEDDTAEGNGRGAVSPLGANPVPESRKVSRRLVLPVRINAADRSANRECRGTDGHPPCRIRRGARDRRTEKPESDCCRNIIEILERPDFNKTATVNGKSRINRFLGPLAEAPISP